jgi:hypothetical protein
VPFADGSQVDLKSGNEKPDASGMRVELQVLAADLRHSFRDFGLAGHASLAAVKAPDLCERPRGDVKRPARGPPQLLGLQQQPEQALFHNHRLLARPLIEAADFAGIAVNRELRFQRFDVVIDFSDVAGRNFVLTNDAKAPFPDGDDVIPDKVMLFKVGRRLSRRDDSSLPGRLGSVPLLSTRDAVNTRDLVLIEVASANDEPIIGLINERWDRPVTEAPRAGSVEVWRIINTTGDAHPIHIHLVQFQILDRQPFDPDALAAGSLVFTGDRVQPPPNERPAFKDTVKSMPGEVTRVIMRFDLPTGTRVRRGDRFRYVFHCHILEHEDNDMMRPYDVVG